MTPLDNLPLRITPALPVHVHAFSLHVVEHVSESGRDGSAHFAVSRSIARDDVEQSALDRWHKGLDEPLWGRAWLLWSGGPRPRVVGHVELRGGRVRSELHRAIVAMGILRPHTGQGHGRRLLETAIVWAREEAELSHLDLGFFSGNERARLLYVRMGFLEVCTRKDAFRLDGVSFDDHQMTLALRPHGERVG